MYLSPCLVIKTSLACDYAIYRERDRGMFLRDHSLLHYLKKTNTQETTSANTKLHANRSHASSLEKQNLIQFGLGDATGGSAVWMQTQNSCVAERRDIKREKNSM